MTRYPVLSTRGRLRRPDHHLWNNHGTWYACFTVLTSAVTAERLRVSLRTRDRQQARTARDRIFASIGTNTITEGSLLC